MHDIVGIIGRVAGLWGYGVMGLRGYGFTGLPGSEAAQLVPVSTVRSHTLF